MTPRDDGLEHPRLGALYRAASREEPPESVDEAIRAAARRHLPRRSRGWVPALAAAAVLVLAIATVLRFPTETMETDSQLSPPAADEPVAETPKTRSQAKRLVEPEIPEMVPQAAPHTDGYAGARRSAGPMPPPLTGVQPEARQAPRVARPASSSGDGRAPEESGSGAGDMAFPGDAVPCEPPEPDLLTDPAALKRRMDVLEREGRDREAACLRLWLRTVREH